MTQISTNDPGTPRSRDDAALRVLSIVLLVAIALGAGCLSAWTLLQRPGAAFVGRLEAQTTYVNADVAGVVDQLLVSEGERVTLEAPLLQISDDELEALIARATQEVSILKSQRDQAEAAATVELTWRLKEIDADIAETQLRSADYLKEKFDWELERSMWADVLSSHDTVMFESGGETFQSMLLKDQLPAEQRMTAMLKHEAAANAIDVSNVQVEICNERLEQLRRLKATLPERVRQTAGVDVAEQRLAQAEAELARLEERRADLVITSSAIGTVGVFHVRRGDHLRPGDPIVEILDDARRWVVVSVPSSAIAEFYPGRSLTLTFPGRQMRTGRVMSVAPQALRDPAGTVQDPVVTVRVEQTGAAWPEAPLGARIDVRLAQ